jgi:uncharacterized coiled-coil protein SlyX
MEPFAEEQFEGNEPPAPRVPTNQWLVIALIALLGIAGIAAAYGVHERGQVEQLTVQAATANNAMNQMQAQVNVLTARLNEMTAAQAAAATPGSPHPEVSPAPPADENGEIPAVLAPPATANTAATPKPAPAKKTTTKRKAPVDKRYAQLKAQLDDQQKQLKETQDQVAKNRADLEGSISSTRDELNGSIAKTHEELVALEKKGERSYFEFDLTKAKTFQRVGPMTLSLRKTDTKHKSYDMSMIVDDNELSKKKVNLYEPIWIHPETGGQPVQVVVNRIDKNLVHGYVSAPKYRPSELAALTSPEGTTAPPTATGSSVAQPQQ